MENVTAKDLKIGSQLRIGGVLFQVYNVFCGDTLAVSRVNAYGQLAKPNGKNIGAYTRQEIDHWGQRGVGSMEIVKI